MTVLAYGCYWPGNQIGKKLTTGPLYTLVRKF